jgi:membrane fusion protein, heavy metal efflux system
MKVSNLFAILTVLVAGGILAAVILRMGSSLPEQAGVLKLQGPRGGSWEYSPREGRIRLPQEALQSAGIELLAAGPARIKTVLELPGQVALNQDRVAHVVPKLAGVATEVRKRLGDPVKKGEVLAVLESRELADLKSQFLAAHKRLELARTTFAREKHLWEERISAEQDYLLARNALAEAEITAATAVQKLNALGVSPGELKQVSLSRPGLNRFELRSPLQGVVIERDLVVGEAIKEDTLVFTIADLSTVWGEFTIYAKDLKRVREGQEVTVKAPALGLTTRASIAHIGPVMGEQSRAAHAHVHLPNPERQWRPGVFITVEVLQEEVTASVAVMAEAVQTYREKPAVFVRDGDAFEVRPVELGRSDGHWVEVVKGLEAGERYAARNSFVLRSELGKAEAVAD